MKVPEFQQLDNFQCIYGCFWYYPDGVFSLRLSLRLKKIIFNMYWYKQHLYIFIIDQMWMNALRNKTVTELNQTVWTKKELLNANVKKDIEKPKAEIVWVSEV